MSFALNTRVRPPSVRWWTWPIIPTGTWAVTSREICILSSCRSMLSITYLWLIWCGMETLLMSRFQRVSCALCRVHLLISHVLHPVSKLLWLMEEAVPAWTIAIVWMEKVWSKRVCRIFCWSVIGRLTDVESGRQLEVLTTEPGLQVYMGNWIEGEFPHKAHNAVALECQHYPDSPNQPAFPSTLLSPGETYHQTTVFRMRLVLDVLEQTRANKI